MTKFSQILTVLLVVGGALSLASGSSSASASKPAPRSQSPGTNQQGPGTGTSQTIPASTAGGPAPGNLALPLSVLPSSGAVVNDVSGATEITLPTVTTVSQAQSSTAPVVLNLGSQNLTQAQQQSLLQTLPVGSAVVSNTTQAPGLNAPINVSYSLTPTGTIYSLTTGQYSSVAAAVAYYQSLGFYNVSANFA